MFYLFTCVSGLVSSTLISIRFGGKENDEKIIKLNTERVGETNSYSVIDTYKRKHE